MLCHYAECQYAVCHILFAILLNVVMLSVVLLNVVVSSVVMLSVVAPPLNSKTTFSRMPLSIMAKWGYSAISMTVIQNATFRTLKLSVLILKVVAPSQHLKYIFNE